MANATFCTRCFAKTSGRTICQACRPKTKAKKRRPHIPKKIRAAVLREPICALCGDDKLAPGESWSVDHIIPIQKGGHPIARGNLQKAHLHCNLQKNKYLK